MKKIAVAYLFLFATFVWAAADPNPAEYTTNVHVSSSRLVVEVPNGVAATESLADGSLLSPANALTNH
jgi:hypothetical protein